jgi:8-oxo-dGTP pyrophosphatase MutT (NUDIX family)
MSSLQDTDAKICSTAAGCLIHNGKVLLVKHKKVKIWLNPGGHIEDNELPHQAAEREFWEETGVKVIAYESAMIQAEPNGHDEYLPNPFSTNLHWVCRENYDHRKFGKKLSPEMKKIWKNGCEQHLNFIYLVKPATQSVEFTEKVEESDGIAWFTLEELDNIETSDNIRAEVQKAFSLIKPS